MLDEKAIRIARAAVAANARMEAAGGPPDIPVPGMEASGGGGQVSAQAYIAEAMGYDPDTARQAATGGRAAPAPAATPARHAPQVVEAAPEPPPLPNVARIGGSYGTGTRKLIERTMSVEQRRPLGSAELAVRAAMGRPLTEAAPVGRSSGLDVSGALQELRTKDRNQIEYETAVKWAGRAVAAYTLGLRSADRAAQVMRFSEGDGYADEAREHAAQVNDGGRLLRFVTEQMSSARDSALAGVIQPDFAR